MIGDPGQGSQMENPNRRVKVYVLGSDGQWDDRGTGYVKCEVIPVSARAHLSLIEIFNVLGHKFGCQLEPFDQELDALGFRVIAENQPQKELLVTRIFEEQVFQRQGPFVKLVL